MTCRLETRYDPDPAAFRMTLVNAGDLPLAPARFAWSSPIRATADARVTGGTLVACFGNFHEIALPAGLDLAAGDRHEIVVEGLAHPARHRVDGPKSAYLTLADGRILPVVPGDLATTGPDSGETRDWPAGAIAQPLALLPWPARPAVAAWRDAPPPALVAAGAPEDLAAAACVADLARRLFPAEPPPFRFAGDGLALGFETLQAAPRGGYRLDFAPGGITLASADPAGRAAGLTALAQIARGAATDPDRFRLPREGYIEDRPRFDWRGAHLDVSRHFWPEAQVMRFLDILAWHRMNVFHWHLTDDEGWRLEIAALPRLTTIGAVRGPGLALPGQHGHIARPYAGRYAQAQVRRIVAHAARLHIDVVPEIDIPGHSTAALAAYPHLRDPDEPADSYRSIQGYPNNALNPALPQTYAFLETVLGETAALFPSPFIHVGGDEVHARSWLASPRARALMAAENLAGTPELQAHFMRRVQAILRGLGRNLAGWDEVADGGGVGPEGTLLVGWQAPEVTAALIQGGYRVVASPGQAYYLDMVQAAGWNEPGASWAGISTPEAAYAYRPDAGLSDTEAGSLAGIQACTWCEHIHDAGILNHMAFPRLSAVAETAWTPEEHKDWQRFAALSRLMPRF
jgi:hexosaminidase